MAKHRHALIDLNYRHGVSYAQQWEKGDRVKGGVESDKADWEKA